MGNINMAFKTIGVLGAGVMGIGVAQCAVSVAQQVILVDTSSEQLEKAKQQMRSDLRMAKMLNARFAQVNIDEMLGRILATTEYEKLATTDFVIENVVENWSVKERVYCQIDGICPAHCIFGANTSAISITRIASATARPDRIVGMHFMNPAHLKLTVEVIPGYHTSGETLDTTKNLLHAMGKDLIVVGDMPGFVSNRVLMVTINEAIFLVQDQVSDAKDIDQLFRSCFGHKMGPLETADLIGLDTILHSLEVLYESYNEDKYRPCPLLKKMVWAGLHGRKNGQGFYDYRTAGAFVQKAVG
jgi:3-hydroxybutyryl-CoA dehydrogenase